MIFVTKVPSMIGLRNTMQRVGTNLVVWKLLSLQDNLKHVIRVMMRQQTMIKTRTETRTETRTTTRTKT